MTQLVACRLWTHVIGSLPSPRQVAFYCLSAWVINFTGHGQ